MGRTRWSHPTNPNLTGFLINKGGELMIQWSDGVNFVSKIPLMDLVDQFEEAGYLPEITHELASGIEQVEARYKEYSKGRRL